MVARFLVTTAIEETWPADNVPVLFLGQWCRLYERRSAWAHRDALVAPYHWDDRQKLHQDYLYLQTLYEELLHKLAAQLNALHRVNHSLRYWRILVGPWLGYFTQILFDRWSMLRRVLQDHEIAGVRVLRYTQCELVPNDMAEFSRFLIGDAWNQVLYGQILDWMGVPVESVAERYQLTLDASSSSAPGSAVGRYKRILADLLSRSSGWLCCEDEFFFIASYLGLKQDLQLQAKLGQIPKLWRPVAVPVCSFEPALRQWQLPGGNDKGEFSSLVRALIAHHIPKAYLEGYRALIHLAESVPWPKKPRAIFTSNSFNADDVFKAWSAKNVKSGTPMIIGQHGGNYGMALWGFTEDHQIAISDRFLTWGWLSAETENLVAVGNLKGFGKKSIEPDNLGVALMVEMALPRYSYHMYSVPVAAGQWQSYFEDQIRFAQALPEELRAELLVRLYPQDFGLGQRQRWHELFPDIQLDDGVQPMARLLKKARIFIATYNATTYLESLSLNIPTIIFWNPNHWELRDGVQPYLEDLKSVGIFHDTPEGAAKQMAAVWDDVPGWWQSPEVQSVRQAFCEQYAHIPEQPLDTLAKLFQSIARP